MAALKKKESLFKSSLCLLPELIIYQQNLFKLGGETIIDSLTQTCNRPRGSKIFFMLNSIEHEIFLLINVKMTTIVGILTFMSRNNSFLGLSESERS